jgi:rhodanese-related sulfurtransferase
MADYAGDISPQEAWEMLVARQDAVLVDVRSRPEWSFVGVAELGGLSKQPRLIPWQIYPEMLVNGRFVEEVAASGVSKDTPLLFLCRSGVRSRSAAIAMTAKGYQACYNIAGGFEGDIDQARHRGQVNGWKAAGLPWVQT